MSAPTPRGRKRQRDAPAHLPAPKNRNGFAFDGSYPDLYDTVLVVEGKKFYVNQKILPSFVLRRIRGSKEGRNRDQRSLADKFQNFLEVVHGVEDLENSTVEAVFDLSNRFDCDHIVKKCKKFLMAHIKVPLQTMLALSIRHNLEELKNKAIDLVKTK